MIANYFSLSLKVEHDLTKMFIRHDVECSA